MGEEKLLSLKKDDFEVQYFRGSGKGGQKRNKTASACRIIHRDSGAVGECQEHRSQAQNKKTAFNRMASTEKFQQWIKIRAIEAIAGKEAIERKINQQMDPKNIKTEVRKEGKWIEE